jgi:hypothetical protein
MKRSQVQIAVLFLVFAFAALTFAGTASAGWTWDVTSLDSGGATDDGTP